ncbi:MAG: cupin domain-containing protein [Ferruginibacter sp.]
MAGLFYIHLRSMDITAYIASGILESYCLGQLTEEQRAEVEQYAGEFPGIRTELKQISDTLEFYSKQNSKAPQAAVKIKLLLKIYEQESGAGKKYPPLIKELTAAADFTNWLQDVVIEEPAAGYDNLAMVELPSTETVTNFMVWAKQGHEEEMHTEYNEFIVILQGHCDMYFNEVKTHYNTGDIIVIPPGIPHTAVITSGEPMVAVVQRQLLAA